MMRGEAPRPRARLGQLAILALIIAASSYERSALGALQEALRHDLALSDNQIALIQGTAIALPQVVTALPLGLYVDRGARVRLLLLAILLGLVGSVATAFAPDFATLFAARLLVSTSITAIYPAAFSIMADLFAPENRGRATTVMHVGSVCGMSLAFAWGGMLLGNTSVALAWRGSMLWLCMPLVVILAMTVLLRDPPRRELRSERRDLGTIARETWQYRGALLPLITGWVMVQVGECATIVWAAPSLMRRFALSTELAGRSMAIVLLIGGLAGPLIGGTLADHGQRRGGLRASIAWLCLLTLAVVPASLFALIPNLHIAWVVLTIFVTVGFAIGTMAIALCLVLVPNELRGLCIGIFTLMGALFGFGVAPLVVSLVAAHFDQPGSISISLSAVGATSALVALYAFWMGRNAGRIDAPAWPVT